MLCSDKINDIEKRIWGVLVASDSENLGER